MLLLFYEGEKLPLITVDTVDYQWSINGAINGNSLINGKGFL